MIKFFKLSSQIQSIIALRCIAIALQLVLIIFVNLGLGYHLPWAPLLGIIGLELTFTFGSYLYYRKQKATEKKQNQLAIFIQICADILFLSLLLFFSGGATNAFVSLLLIPIAIAAVTLSRTLLSVVAILAITSYSILLWLLPMSVMHGNMQGHFIAMGINFLFSALVVALVVGKMARSMNKQALAIAAYREDLLKQEQATSLGVASAQITHQLATPIATVQLLADELSEDFPNNDVINDMQSQLNRCTASLSEFRTMVLDIKEQVIKTVSCDELFKSIIENTKVNYPDINIILINKPTEKFKHAAVSAGTALIPAILNLINNAVRASKANNQIDVALASEVIGNQWKLSIRDFGKGFTLKKLDELGVKPVHSDQGFGMAVFLSHASLESLGGQLALTNHKEGGALVTLSMPLAFAQASQYNSTGANK